MILFEKNIIHKKMNLLITLERLYVYRSRNYPELFYYYAYAFNDGSTTKIQGLATPELMKALVEHLERGLPFECKVQEKEESLKLVELHDKAYKSRIEEFCGIAPPSFQKGDRIDFKPKQIILRKHVPGLLVQIKGEDGIMKTGVVENDWIFWYLTAMREGRSIELITNGTKFASPGFDTTGQSGPNEVCYGECAEYNRRKITTYLDNPLHFYFAQ